MQTRIQKSLLFFFAALLFISGTLLLNSCCDEVEPPKPPPELPEFPDPEEDLAAYLSSSMGVLMVDPEYQEDAIMLFGLILTPEGRLQYYETNEDGETLLYEFDLILIDIPYLFHEARLEMEELWSPFEQNGVWKRLYKNAQCGETVKKKTYNCTNLAQLIPESGAIAFRHKIEKVHKRCKKGTGLCAEELRVVGTTYFYDKPCRSPNATDGRQVATKPFKLYRCDF